MSPTEAEQFRDGSLDAMLRAASAPDRQLETVGGVAAIGGLLLGYVGHSWPPPALVGAFVLAAAAIVAIRLRDRWGWPWQVAIGWSAWGRLDELRAIVGSKVTKANLETWLESTSDRSPAGRYDVLRWLDRSDEARLLVESLPNATPEDRFHKAAIQAAFRWRDGQDLDQTEAREAANRLAGEARRRADVHLELMDALAVLADGGDLRGLPAPRIDDLRLTMVRRIFLWQVRVWPLVWFVGMFLATWLVVQVVGWL